jgi:very-short-patch-repair endonuclease
MGNMQTFKFTLLWAVLIILFLIFHKIDFDRQRIISNYIVDFYIKALGLIIEVDGSSHDYKQAYDATRQAYLESFGLKVFRCTDFDVKNNINSVFTSLEDFIINEYGENITPAFSQSTKTGELALINAVIGPFNKDYFNIFGFPEGI